MLTTDIFLLINFLICIQLKITSRFEHALLCYSSGNNIGQRNVRSLLAFSATFKFQEIKNYFFDQSDFCIKTPCAYFIYFFEIRTQIDANHVDKSFYSRSESIWWFPFYLPLNSNSFKFPFPFFLCDFDFSPHIFSFVGFSIILVFFKHLRASPIAAN